MTTTLPKCYSNLVSEPVQWLMQPHGDAHVIGFRGSKKDIEKCHNLFINYDTRPKGGALELINLFPDLSYVYITQDRLISTLHLFFHVNAVRDGDVMVTQGWKGDDTDESPLEYVYSYDEAEADWLATLATEAFTATIKHQNFIPSIPKPHGDIYYMGKRTREDYSPVEDYASAATA